MAEGHVDDGGGPSTAEWSPLDELDDLDGYAVPADPAVVADSAPEPPAAEAPGAEPSEPIVVESSAGQPRPVAVIPAASVVVAGQYHFVSWWKLALMLLAVWIPAAGAGLGLFAWWYSLADKTPAVFVVLVYAVVTMVAGMITAMVVDKPLVSAVAIGLISAVFISGVAAAPLYGHYYCHHVQRCLGGILPY